jgi:hypothetical protein
MTRPAVINGCQRRSARVGRPPIRAIVDSAGTANAPRGPVSAGGGGAAGMPLPGNDRSVPVGLLAMIAVLASVACVATFRVSRTRA